MVGEQTVDRLDGIDSRSGAIVWGLNTIRRCKIEISDV